MMPQYASSFGFLFLNLVSVFLFTITLIRLEKGGTKYSLFFFIFSSLMYCNLLLYLWSEGFDISDRAFVAKLVFSSGTLLLISFGSFIIHFTGHSIKNSPLFIAIAINLIILFFVSIFSSLIVDELVYLNDLQSFQYGYLHKYFLFSWATCGVYVYIILGIAYRDADNLILKYQIKNIFFTSIVAFLLIFITNGLIPFMFGRSRFAAFGGFWLLFFFSGVLYVLLQGESLFLKKSFSNLTKELMQRSSKNIWSLNKLIGTLRFANQSNATFNKPIKFYDQSDNYSRIFISNINKEKPSIENKSTGFLASTQMKNGFFDTILNLEYSNKRLMFLVIKAQSIIQEKWLGKEIQEIQIPTGKSADSFYYLKDYKTKILENKKEYEKLLGQEYICYSNNQFKNINESLALANFSTLPVLIMGEKATGKTSLARAMHFHRTKKLPDEIYCTKLSLTDIHDQVQAFLNKKNHKDEPFGLVLKNIEELGSDLNVLEPLLHDCNGKKYVYLTSDEHFFSSSANVPKTISHSLIHTAINTIALNQRKEDIFHLSLFYLEQISTQFNIHVEGISKSLMDDFLSYLWPGNITELKYVIQDSVLKNKLPFINEYKLRKISKEQTLIGLSPLEDSERRTIVHHLEKHNFNKNRTRLELEITINTLNAKIKKYGIVVNK